MTMQVIKPGTKISNKFKMTISSLISIFIIGGPITEAVIIQAVIEIDDSPENFIKVIMEKMDHLIDCKRNIINNQTEVNKNGDTEMHLQIASSTLMNLVAIASSAGKRLSLRGNMSDNKNDSKSPFAKFQFYAEITNRTSPLTTSMDISRWPLGGCDDETDDDVDDENDNSSNSNGGILDPIVKTIEPYVVTLVNIVFHGMMTSIISKMMDNANMTGELRIT